MLSSLRFKRTRGKARSIESKKSVKQLQSLADVGAKATAGLPEKSHVCVLQTVGNMPSVCKFLQEITRAPEEFETVEANICS
jgi:hypothetical protein